MEQLRIAFCILMYFSVSVTTAVELDIPEGFKYDQNGYVAYCPCMGRFGNQADHFLGVLAFAKGLDRTLILPPWIEYAYMMPSSIQVPFDKYFQVEPLRMFHKVITMEKFMEEIAPVLWPPGNRIGICFRFRDGDTCAMKEGNPFGPFWDNFNIDFDNYRSYQPLSYSTNQHNIREKWDERFPVSTFPVLAFSGAPASFPVTEENRKLHYFLRWSDYINKEADDFIAKELSNGPFVGIHLRRGSDFKKACEHASSGRQFFASPQCLGFNNEHGQMSDELCYADWKTINKQLKKTIRLIKATAVFVATDHDPSVKELKNNFKNVKVKIIQRTPSEPHIDLAILGKSDHYIGNCVSSFSAFAKRERDASNKPSSFWAFNEKGHVKNKTEL
ncbi:GDP-fucose protein O-fucosyltransferase 1-like [Anneissia japonica]|uniref:GDP-fucose protein O-fucosyltransferase 1-like n=1 Tax=Anneissia japonica TaxID=1529436 RepID=UPI0014256C17|nr:GDP-fucose protein O-fucosyltransferase 1-like [Anneissia japonica]